MRIPHPVGMAKYAFVGQTHLVRGSSPNTPVHISCASQTHFMLNIVLNGMTLVVSVAGSDSHDLIHGNKTVGVMLECYLENIPFVFFLLLIR